MRADTKVKPVAPVKATEDTDHRTIVGRRRRATTESKIILAAIPIFAELGPVAPVIDDFIKAAGIARGTFYNYFRSTEELLKATSDWLRQELMELIDVEVRAIKNPAIRFGMGVRLWLKWAQANPSWSRCIARVWNFTEYGQPYKDIQKGIRAKLFSVPSPKVAWDVLAGAVRQAMLKIGEGGTPPTYGDDVVRMCLQALGAERELIAQLMSLAHPNLDGSLERNPSRTKPEPAPIPLRGKAISLRATT